AEQGDVGAAPGGVENVVAEASDRAEVEYNALFQRFCLWLEALPATARRPRGRPLLPPGANRHGATSSKKPPPRRARSCACQNAAPARTTSCARTTNGGGGSRSGDSMRTG